MYIIIITVQLYFNLASFTRLTLCVYHNLLVFLLHIFHIIDHKD